MADKGLLDRCRAFVREQSCGEWDDDTINEDAAKLRRFILQEVNTYPAVEGLVRTLEFYADPIGWKKKNDPENLVAIPDFYFELDFGMEAKEALSRFRSLQNGGTN